MHIKKISALVLILLSSTMLAQDSTFIFTTNNFQPYFPGYIGNGHLSLSTSRLGTLPSESYMAKVYDHAENDIPRIANLPACNEINYYNGVKWLNDAEDEAPRYSPFDETIGGDSAEFNNYTQTLNMYNGTLETSYDWNVDTKESKINVLSFISRSDKNIAVTRFELTTNFSDTVKLIFPLNERERPDRMPLAKLEKIDPNPPGKWPAEWYPGFTEITKISAEKSNNGGRIQALSHTEGRKTKVAFAAEIFYEGEISNPGISVMQNTKSASVEIKFVPEKNKKYTFYKIVSAVSEKEAEGDLLNQASVVCSSATGSGFNKLYDGHKKEWARLWETDIILEGNDSLQRIVRSMIYYILCSTAENTAFSVPPMGLATSGYYGHIFWDADTYMFPPFLFMHPGIAKSMVMFRHSTLDAAKQNAKKNDYNGAMYPWESDEIGEETTPYFAYQNALKENHIVGDVAFAQWQYFQATNDTAWLRRYGSEVIFATADFWVSRVDYNKEKDRYEIGKVVSVSEGHIDVSNETYTNSIAKLNLEIAVKAANVLNNEVNTKWKEISSKMFIPYNEEAEYHPTFENAGAGEGASELWSSVVNLLTYPLQVEMSENTKRNNLTHVVKSLEESGAGAMMGTNFVAIIAAELGMDSLFNAVIEKTLYGYLRPPFNALAETHTNNSINFITGAGSFLQQVIFGYTGLRLTDEGLVEKYKPMLPEGVTSLTLKNFTVNNKKVDIVVEDNKMQIKPL